MPFEQTDKIQVLIVDDSAAARMALADLIATDPAFHIMATAKDAYVAAERIRKRIPDLIFLDLELPGMDGLTFLRKLMAQKPIPVIVCSRHVEERPDLVKQALAIGAVDVLAKPRLDTPELLAESQERFCAAAHAATRKRRKPAPPSGTEAADTPADPPSMPAKRIAIEAKLSADVLIPPMSPAEMAAAREKLPLTPPLICIGASTGGTEALREVLEALPADAPPVVIVQHMPEKFTSAFAQRLDGLCAISVKEAEQGDKVLPGRALIAPGNHHVQLVRTGSHYSVNVIDGPPISRHRPSVDILFRSAAYSAGFNAMGIILTGMGDDGARCMGDMRAMGASTIAQDEDTCVVFGMPKEAIDRGAAQKVLPLGRMAHEIMAFAGRHSETRLQPGPEGLASTVTR